MPNFPFYIARRYLFSKKSTNVINLISGISVFGVTIGTAALLIIMSVFNGLDLLIKSLFSSFDPDIKITLIEGKKFNLSDSLINQIQNLEGVAIYSEVLEENALIRYDSRQFVATVKGVDEKFTKMTGIDTMLYDGSFTLQDDNNDYAVIGHLVATNLGVGLNFIDPLIIYSPKKEAKHLNLETAVNRRIIYPKGIFSIQPEVDQKYILVPMDFARGLFNESSRISALEIKTNPLLDVDEVKAELKAILGKNFAVKDRYQQQELLYKTIKSEKFIGFLILGFIIVIASFNIIGSLTMLIIDKKKDIIILQNIGASLKEIRKIFLFEGWSISLLGAGLGIAIGYLFCYMQETIGIIPLLGNGAFIVDYYPVKTYMSDTLAVFGVVLIIGFLASWYPVRYITRRYL
jgi:lipoprotein-releasing system permease protein